MWIAMLALLLFGYGTVASAEPAFSEKCERGYKIFNPANRYQADNPLNPANQYNPDNALKPANQFNPSTPFAPLNRLPNGTR